MGKWDHRIHLGRKDSLKSSPQIHSSTKHVFSGPSFGPKKSPGQNVDPTLPDLGCFSKSLQKERTANPSEILSRIHHSKLQTEPRGEKHIFCVCSFKNQKFGVGALPGIRSDSGLHFPRKCCKTIVFYTVWEPAWYTKADPEDPPEMVDSWQFAPKVTRA